LANAYVAEWCRKNWENEDRFSDREMPEDDQALIDLWFVNSDWRTIEPMEVDAD
jgi:hypothetical protein